MAKLEEGTAVWIYETGGIKLRVFSIVGRKEGKALLDFGNQEQIVVKEKFIRVRRIVIFQTSSGKIIAQDPDKWRNVDLKKHDIKVLRFNLQNMGIQEGRSAIHRWTPPQDRLAKLSPLIKLLLICIVIGVIGWASLKFGTYVLDVVMKARLLPCSEILPRLTEAPLGAIVNATAGPVGA